MHACSQSKSVPPPLLNAVERILIISFGIVLGVTGVAKVLSSIGKSKVLAIQDPIIGISFSWLLLMVGGVEIAIALVCIFNKKPIVSLGLVAWISSSFLIYRIGLWWINWTRPCSCLGNLTDVLHISHQTADNIIKVVLAYLLIGSYMLIFLFWKKHQDCFVSVERNQVKN